MEWSGGWVKLDSFKMHNLISFRRQQISMTIPVGTQKFQKSDSEYASTYSFVVVVSCDICPNLTIRYGEHFLSLHKYCTRYFRILAKCIYLKVTLCRQTDEEDLVTNLAIYSSTFDVT